MSDAELMAVPMSAIMIPEVNRISSQMTYTKGGSVRPGYGMTVVRESVITTVPNMTKAMPTKKIVTMTLRTPKDNERRFFFEDSISTSSVRSPITFHPYDLFSRRIVV